jgi:hypothetical protein
VRARYAFRFVTTAAPQLFLLDLAHLVVRQPAHDLDVARDHESRHVSRAKIVNVLRRRAAWLAQGDDHLHVLLS